MSRPSGANERNKWPARRLKGRRPPAELRSEEQNSPLHRSTEQRRADQHAAMLGGDLSGGWMQAYRDRLQHELLTDGLLSSLAVCCACRLAPIKHGNLADILVCRQRKHHLFILNAWWTAFLSVRALYEPYDAAPFKQHKLFVTAAESARIASAASNFAEMAQELTPALRCGNACSFCADIFDNIERNATIEQILLSSSSAQRYLQVQDIMQKSCVSSRSQLSMMAAVQQMSIQFKETNFFSTDELNMPAANHEFISTERNVFYGGLHGQISVTCSQSTYKTSRCVLRQDPDDTIEALSSIDKKDKYEYQQHLKGTSVYECDFYFHDTLNYNNAMKIGKASSIDALIRSGPRATGSTAKEQALVTWPQAKTRNRISFFEHPPAVFKKTTISTPDVEIISLDASLAPHCMLNVFKLQDMNVAYVFKPERTFAVQSNELLAHLQQNWNSDVVMIEDQNSNVLNSFTSLQNNMKKFNSAASYGYVLGMALFRLLLKVTTCREPICPGAPNHVQLALKAFETYIGDLDFETHDRMVMHRIPGVLQTINCDIAELTSVLNYLERQLLNTLQGRPLNAASHGYASQDFYTYTPLQMAQCILDTPEQPMLDAELNILLYMQCELFSYVTDFDFFKLKVAPNCTSQFRTEIIAYCLIIACARARFKGLVCKLKHCCCNRNQLSSCCACWLHCLIKNFHTKSMTVSYCMLMRKTVTSADKQSQAKTAVQSKLALANVVLYNYCCKNLFMQAAAHLQLYVRRAISKHKFAFGSMNGNTSETQLTWHNIQSRKHSLHANASMPIQQHVVALCAVTRLQAAIRATQRKAFDIHRLYHEMPTNWAVGLLQDDAQLHNRFQQITIDCSKADYRSMTDANGKQYSTKKPPVACFMGFWHQACLRLRKKVHASEHSARTLAVCQSLTKWTHNGSNLELPDAIILMILDNLRLSRNYANNSLPIPFSHHEQFCTVPSMPFMYALQQDTNVNIMPALPQHFFSYDQARVRMCQKRHLSTFTIPAPCYEKTWVEHELPTV